VRALQPNGEREDSSRAIGRRCHRPQRESPGFGGELAKLQLQRVNETVNQPSGKKPEWDKGNDADPDKPPRKRKLGGRRPGSGNRPKTNPKTGPFDP